MLIIENCNSLSDLRQKLIDGEEVRTRQEPYKISEYDKDHIWYKGNQYISLRRFLEVKAEAEKEPCEDAISRQAVLDLIEHYNSDGLGSVFYGYEEGVKFADKVKKLPPITSQEPCEDAIRREDAINAVSEALEHVFVEHEDIAKKMINKLPPVNPQPKTGHWVYKIYGGFHEQGDWYCSHCDYQFNYGNGHAKHCPECGYEMSEAPTEEVMSEYDKRRCNYPNDI